MSCQVKRLPNYRCTILLLIYGCVNIFPSAKVSECPHLRWMCWKSRASFFVRSKGGRMRLCSAIKFRFSIYVRFQTDENFRFNECIHVELEIQKRGRVRIRLKNKAKFCRRRMRTPKMHHSAIRTKAHGTSPKFHKESPTYLQISWDFPIP